MSTIHLKLSKVTVRFRNESVPFMLAGRVLGGKGKVDHGYQRHGVRLDSDRDNHTVGAASASANSPEEVLVLASVHGHEVACWGDYLRFDDVVCAHTVCASGQAMATTGRPAHDSDVLDFLSGVLPQFFQEFPSLPYLFRRQPWHCV